MVFQYQEDSIDIADVQLLSARVTELAIVEETARNERD